MKFNRIMALAKKNKRIDIINSVNGQWLSIGGAVYYIGNTGLNEQNIKPLFNMGDDWHIKSTDIKDIKRINFNDIDDWEEPATVSDITILFDDEYFTTLTGKDTLNTILINEDYLKPLSDEPTQYFIRTDNNLKYLALKRGLILIAVILPHYLDEDFKKAFDLTNKSMSRLNKNYNEELKKAAEELGLDWTDDEDMEEIKEIKE